MKDYRGTIIRESLEDASVLGSVKVTAEHEEPDQDDPGGTWHLVSVRVSLDDIKRLQPYLKRDGGWYMHFWRGRDVTVVFRDRMFELDYDDETTWRDAVEYGLAMGVPREQLDFLID